MKDLILKNYPVLNHGFVKLVDVMGDDKRIVNAARVSHDLSEDLSEATSNVPDERLINYLLKNAHWTPFEMVVFTFAVQCPIFIARQWLRHRAASFNEFSMRYSEAPDLFYIPEVAQVQYQDKKNKQGSAEALPVEEAEKVREVLTEQSKAAYQAYQKLLDQGVSRELARTLLPVSIYTKFYFKVDLRNLFNFLNLRLHPHAQWEIRQYAEAIQDITRQCVPKAYEAFEEHILFAKTFSRSQLSETP